MADPAGLPGTPLARKLGIRDACRVLLVAAPPDLDLGPLHGGVTVHRRPGRSAYDVVLVFTRDRRELAARVATAQGRVTTAGALWVAWPKRSSGVATDLDDDVVRRHGLALGLVDNKVCAIDATWSGLRFVVRLRDR